jgi:hypothetical protein
LTQTCIARGERKNSVAYAAINPGNRKLRIGEIVVRLLGCSDIDVSYAREGLANRSVGSKDVCRRILERVAPEQLLEELAGELQAIGAAAEGTEGDSVSMVGGVVGGSFKGFMYCYFFTNKSQCRC